MTRAQEENEKRIREAQQRRDNYAKTHVNKPAHTSATQQSTDAAVQSSQSRLREKSNTINTQKANGTYQPQSTRIQKQAGVNNTGLPSNTWQYDDNGTRRPYESLSNSEVISWLGSMSDDDERKPEALENFKAELKDKQSPHYDPYYNSGSTNQTAKDLFGVDTFDQKWLDDNAGLEQYVNFSDSGYTTPKKPTKPGKYASQQELDEYNRNMQAYEYWYIKYKDEPRTQAAETQLADLMGKMDAYAKQNGANGSYDDFIGKIDWSAYKQLKDMQDIKSVGNVENLTRTVNLSDNYLRAAYNAAVTNKENISDPSIDWLTYDADQRNMPASERVQTRMQNMQARMEDEKQAAEARKANMNVFQRAMEWTGNALNAAGNGIVDVAGTVAENIDNVSGRKFKSDTENMLRETVDKYISEETSAPAQTDETPADPDQSRENVAISGMAGIETAKAMMDANTSRYDAVQRIQAALSEGTRILAESGVSTTEDAPAGTIEAEFQKSAMAQLEQAALDLSEGGIDAIVGGGYIMPVGDIISHIKEGDTQQHSYSSLNEMIAKDTSNPDYWDTATFAATYDYLFTDAEKDTMWASYMTQEQAYTVVSSRLAQLNAMHGIGYVNHSMTYENAQNVAGAMQKNMPAIATMANQTDFKAVTEIAAKMESGEEVTPQEKMTYNDFMGIFQNEYASWVQLGKPSSDEISGIGMLADTFLDLEKQAPGLGTLVLASTDSKTISDSFKLGLDDEQLQNMTVEDLMDYCSGGTYSSVYGSYQAKDSGEWWSTLGYGTFVGAASAMGDTAMLGQRILANTFKSLGVENDVTRRMDEWDMTKAGAQEYLDMNADSTQRFWSDAAYTLTNQISTSLLARPLAQSVAAYSEGLKLASTSRAVQWGADKLVDLTSVSVMATSAGAAQTTNLLNQGYDPLKANLWGVYAGATEAVTEMFSTSDIKWLVGMDEIAGSAGKLAAKTLSDRAEAWIFSTAKSIASENMEEIAGIGFDKLGDMIFTGETDMSNLWDEITSTVKQTSVTTALLNIGNAPSQFLSRQNLDEHIANGDKLTAADVRELDAQYRMECELAGMVPGSETREAEMDVDRELYAHTQMQTNNGANDIRLGAQQALDGAKEALYKRAQAAQQESDALESMIQSIISGQKTAVEMADPIAKQSEKSNEAQKQLDFARSEVERLETQYANTQEQFYADSNAQLDAYRQEFDELVKQRAQAIAHGEDATTESRLVERAAQRNVRYTTGALSDEQVQEYLKQYSFETRMAELAEEPDTAEDVQSEFEYEKTPQRETVNPEPAANPEPGLDVLNMIKEEAHADRSILSDKNGSETDAGKGQGDAQNAGSVPESQSGGTSSDGKGVFRSVGSTAAVQAGIVQPGITNPRVAAKLRTPSEIIQGLQGVFPSFSNTATHHTHLSADPGVRGRYILETRGVEMRANQDLDTFVHENLGHAWFTAVGAFEADGTTPTAEWAAGLNKLQNNFAAWLQTQSQSVQNAYSNPAVHAQEGCAAFSVAYVLQGRQAAVNMVSEDFVKKFEKTMTSKQRRQIRRATQSIQTYMAADDLDKARAYMSARGRNERDGNQGAVSTILQDNFDVYEPLIKSDKRATKLQGQESRAYYDAQRVYTADKMVRNLIENDLVTRDGKGTKLGSFKDLFKAINKNDMHDFDLYNLLRHDFTGRKAEGKPVFPEFDEMQEADMILKLEKQHPEFQNTANHMLKWWDTFMSSWVADSGLTENAAETYQALRDKYPMYVPSFRDMNSQIDRLYADAAKGIGSQYEYTFKTAKGSDLHIVSPIIGQMQIIQNVVNAAVRQDAMRSVAEWAKIPGMEDVIVEVEAPKSAKQTMLNIMQQVQDTAGKAQNEVITGQNALDNMLQQIADASGIMETLGKTLHDNEARELTVCIDETGAAHYYRIADDGIRKAMNAMPPEAVGAALKMYGMFSNFCKGMYTSYSPAFIVSNLSRDTFQGYINAQTADPAKFMYYKTRALTDLIMEKLGHTTKSLNRYRNAGGGDGIKVDSSMNYKAMIKEIKPSKARFMNPAYIPMQSFNVINDVIEAHSRYADALMRFDTADRYSDQLARGVQMSKSKLSKILSDAQIVTMGANEVTTNFSRHGLKSHNIDKMFMFVGAAKNGIYQEIMYAKNAWRDPVGYAKHCVKLASVMGGLGYLSYKAISSMGDRVRKYYESLSENIKQDNFIVPPFWVSDEDFDGNFIVIPKPKAWYSAALDMGRMIAEGIDKSGSVEEFLKYDFGEFATEAFTGLIDELNPYESSPLDPITGVMQNQTWYHTAINPEWMVYEGLSKDLQKTESTSPLGEGLAKFLNYRITPADGDYLIKQFFGFYGKAAVNVSNEAQTVQEAIFQPIVDRVLKNGAVTNDVVSNVYDTCDFCSTVVKDCAQKAKNGQDATSIQLREGLDAAEVEAALNEIGGVGWNGKPDNDNTLYGHAYAAKKRISEIYDEIDAGTVTEQDGRWEIINIGLEVGREYEAFRRKYVV